MSVRITAALNARRLKYHVSLMPFSGALAAECSVLGLWVVVLDRQCAAADLHCHFGTLIQSIDATTPPALNIDLLQP